MTPERRNEIFAQEALTTENLKELMGFPDLSQASELLGQIKLKSNLLNKKGKIHVMDYFIYFGIDPSGRYVVMPRTDISGGVV